MQTIYKAILDAQCQGAPVALATIVEVKGSSPAARNSKMLVWRDGKTIGTVGGGCLENDVRLAALDCIDTGKSDLLTITLTAARAADDGLICGGKVTVFIEPMLTPALLLMGGGHVCCEISKLAKHVGFRVTIMDDRDEFVNKDRFPEADETVSQSFESFTESAEWQPGAYIVIATRGHNYDGLCLEWALQQDANYIGMIGSKTKRDLLYDDLRSKGISNDVLGSVHTPVGLDIGAETREEIAVSVVAELIRMRRLNRV